MKKGTRTARVSEAIREVIAEELELLDDPRLGWFTVTGVDVTGDLREATAYYTSARQDEGRLRDPEPSERLDTSAALVRLVPRVKEALGQRLRLRYVPHLTFSEDLAPAVGSRIDDILRSWDGADHEVAVDESNYRVPRARLDDDDVEDDDDDDLEEIDDDDGPDADVVDVVDDDGVDAGLGGLDDVRPVTEEGQR